MKAKKRNLISLVLLIVVGAVIARVAMRKLEPTDPRLLGDPNQVVVETRYSLPWHKIISVRKGPNKLFDLPRMLHWNSGGTVKEVHAAFGVPQYQFEFMADDYYVWEADVRYDWDLENEFAGSYLSINFSYSGYVQSVTISKDPPLDSEPVPEGTNPLPQFEEETDYDDYYDSYEEDAYDSDESLEADYCGTSPSSLAE